MEEITLWTKGEHADFHVALLKIVWDAAGQRTLDADQDLRADTAEMIEEWKQVEASQLIRGNQQTAAVERFEFFHRAGRFGSQFQHAVRVILQHFAGGGQGAVARAAFKKHLAQIGLELANDLADGGLSAVEALGGAGESFLFGDGKESL